MLDGGVIVYENYEKSIMYMNQFSVIYIFEFVVQNVAQTFGKHCFVYLSKLYVRLIQDPDTMYLCMFYCWSISILLLLIDQYPSIADKSVSF